MQVTERRALFALPVLLGAIACASPDETLPWVESDASPPADAGATMDSAAATDKALDRTGDAPARRDADGDVGARDGSVGVEVFTATDAPVTPPPRSGGYYASTRVPHCDRGELTRAFRTLSPFSKTPFLRRC